MFDLSDDFATVTESLYDDLETTLWQASMKGQLYNNSMTALQILIWRPCDHAVSYDYTSDNSWYWKPKITDLTNLSSQVTP